MKVLHVLDHSLPLHAGYAFRTHSILLVQKSLGWHTRHVTSCKHALESDNSETVVDGVRYERTSTANAFLYRNSVTAQLEIVRSLASRIRAICREWHPDVVHAHSPSLNALAALTVPRRHYGALVYEMRASWEDASVDHGTSRPQDLRYRASRALESFCLQRADAVVTICEGLKKEIISRGVDPSRVTVVENAVSPDAFGRRERPDNSLRETLGLPQGPVVGFAGSFYRYEGLELLVRAVALLRDRGAPVSLLLVGGGSEQSSLVRLTSELKLQSYVHMPGRVPQADVARYYALCDALVYPRTKIRLTDMVTPLKPLEAMAAGIPVIASDVGGHRELIEDGATGTLFPSGDVVALADTIQRAAADPRELSRRAERAGDWVLSHRTWEKVVPKYGAIYEEALGARGSD